MGYDSRKMHGVCILPAYPIDIDHVSYRTRHSTVENKTKKTSWFSSRFGEVVGERMLVDDERRPVESDGVSTHACFLSLHLFPRISAKHEASSTKGTAGDTISHTL